MAHSDGSRYGENLYKADNPDDIDQMCEYACKAWYAESKKYNFNSGDFSVDTGHFTQLIWKSSERVGVGESGHAGGSFFLVARYFPPGNMVGEFKSNVGQLRKVPMSCLSKVGMKYKDLVKFSDRVGIPDVLQYFLNNSAPCDMLNRTSKTNENPQRGGTQGIGGGTQGNRVGNLLAGSKEPVLVIVPIAEPKTEHLIQPNMVQLTPSEQHIQPGGPSSPSSPLGTSQPIIPTTWPVITQEKAPTNPSQATTAQDSVLGRKRTTLH